MSISFKDYFSLLNSASSFEDVNLNFFSSNEGFSSLALSRKVSQLKIDQKVPEKYSNFIKVHLKECLDKSLSEGDLYFWLTKYLRCEFFGSTDEFKKLFDSAQHQRELALAISYFYTSEQLFKLICLRDVLFYYPKERTKCLFGPPHESKEGVVQMCLSFLKTSSSVVSSLNFDSVSSSELAESIRSLVRILNNWNVVLQIINVSIEDAKVSFSQSIDFLELCVTLVLEVQPLLLRLPEYLSRLCQNIYALSSLFFVQIFDFPFLLECPDEEPNVNSGHVCAGENSLWDNFSRHLVKVCTHLPVVGIAWFSVMSKYNSVSTVVQRIGELSLRQNLFGTCYEMIRAAENEDGNIISRFRVSLFHLIRILITQFELNNLTDNPNDVIKVLKLCLWNKENANVFFQDIEKHVSHEVGFCPLFLSTLSSFPESSAPLLSILANACHDTPTAIKIYNIVSGLNAYSSEFESEDLESTCGYFSQSGESGGSSVKITGWLFSKTCIMKFLVPQSNFVTQETLNDMEIVASVINLIDRLLDNGLSLLPSIVQILELLPQLIHNVSRNYAESQWKMSVQIIESSLSCLKPLMKVRPDLVLNELVLSKILPEVKFKRTVQAAHCASEECEIGSSILTGLLFPLELKSELGCRSSRVALDLLSLSRANLFVDKDFVGESWTNIMKNMVLFPQLIMRYFVPELTSLSKLNNFENCKFLCHCISSLIEFLDFLDTRDANWAEAIKEDVSRTILYSYFGDEITGIFQLGNEQLMIALKTQLIHSSRKGSGSELVALVKNCFQLMLKVWPFRKSSEITVIEQKLFQENEGYAFSRLVSFLFHQLDSELPFHACNFLKLLAQSSTTSFFTFLHTLKEPVRDRFNRVLSKATESEQLKSAVIDVMISCVDCQPAFSDFLYNFDTCAKTPKQPSVLTPLIDIITTASFESRSEQKSKVGLEYAKALKLVHVIWTETSAQIQLQTYMKAQPKFWTSLFSLVFKPDLAQNREAVSDIVSCVSDVLKTVAIETSCFCFVNGQNGEIKKLVSRFFWEGFCMQWFQVCSNLSSNAMKTPGKGTDDSNQWSGLFELLSGLRHLLTVMLNKSETLKIVKQMDKSELETILLTSFKCLKSLVLYSKSAFEEKTQNERMLIEDVLKIWSLIVLQLIQQVDLMSVEILDALIDSLSTLVKVDFLDCYYKLTFSTFASLTFMLQGESAPKVKNQKQVSLIVSTSNLVLRKYSNQEGRVSTDLDQILDICISALSALFHGVSSVEFFLAQLNETDVIATFLRLFEHAIAMLGNQSQLASSILSFFVHLSMYKSSAQFLARCNVHEAICLALQSEATATNSSRKLDAETSKDVNCFASFLVLSANLLSHNESAYLEQSFDVISCFETRISDNFAKLYFNQSEPFLNEVLTVLQFVQKLSVYMKSWRYRLRDNFETVTKSMASACQTCIALLIRPKYFKYLLLHGAHPSDRRRLSTSDSSGNHDSLGGRGKLKTSSTGVGSSAGAGSASLSRQRSLSSTILTTGTSFTLEDAHLSGDELIEKQRKLLEIVTLVLVSFNHMTLPMDQACLLTSCSPDLTQFPLLMHPSFSSPSIECDSVPCLGTLLSCCNYAVGLLIARTDTGKSPRRVAESPGAASRQLMPRQCILLMLENAVLLLVSQSSLFIQRPSVDFDSSKQAFVRDVTSELETFVTSITRYFHRTGVNLQSQAETGSKVDTPSGPGSSSSKSQASSNLELTVYHIVEMFLNRCLKSPHS